MSKGSATTTTSTAPNPVAGQAYDQLIQQAGQVAATPYQAYTGELTAPINQQQQQGVGTINQYATSAVPYLQGAESTIQGAAQPLTQAQIQQYQSPYTQDVVNATEAQFNNQNAQQQQQVLGNAAAQGALGGDRTAVAQSVLAGQQQAQEAPVIAGLENQGYTQALATAGQQFQQNPEQAAYGMVSTGTALENAGLTGANAQFGAGTAEQQTQQAQDTAAYQQYEQALQYPFATLGWEAGIDTGVGSQMGGTSSTTAPPPNSTAQDLGLGIAGIGALGTAGGSAGIAGLAPLALALARGGRTSGRVQTIPETPATLRAQQRQLVSGHRRAQMFPHGTNELNLPHGMARTEADGGVVHHNPKHISADQVKQLSAQGRENEMLDLGPYSKNEIHRRLQAGERPIAVVERDPQGTEVRAALGTQTTAHHIHAAMDRTKSPGHHLGIEHPHATLAARMRGGAIQGLAAGGAPALPYGTAGAGWVPQMSITGGQGAPRPPGSPNQGQTQSAQQMVQNATGLAGSMKKAMGDTTTNNPAFGGGNSLTDEFGGSSSAPLEGLDASDYGVGFKEGGRIYMKRQSAPVRAGLGMASFMPRRHFDSGGSATDDDTVSFDDRWNKPPVPAGLYNNSSGDANPLENILKFQTYGQASPYAPAAGVSETPRVAADDDLPPQITGGSPSAPQAGVGSALGFADDGSRNAPSAAPPDSVNETPREPAEAETKKGLFSPDFYQSLMSAGLGMMASRSPFLGTAIGEGGLQGLSTYSDLQKQHVAQSEKQQDLDLKVKQLNQAAKAEQDRIALETKAQNFTETQMTPAQKAEADFRERNLQRENLAPVKIGQDIMGRDVLGVRAPDGGFLDPVTMKPIDPSRLSNTQAPAANSGAPEATATQPKIGPLPPRDEGMAQQIAHYEIPPPSGFALAKPNSPAPMWLARADEISRAENNGEPYDSTQFGMRNKAVKDFGTGQLGQKVTFFNNAVQHFGTMDGLITAMGSGDVQLINRAKQAFQNQFGYEAPGNFDAAKNIVGQEIVKAIVANGGGEAERQAAAATLAAAKSPEQLRGILNTYRELAGAQLRDLKVQYENTTGLHNFEKKLIPESQVELQKIEARVKANASGNTAVAAPAAVPAPEQRQRNQVYQTPKGPMKWTGTGWVAAQ